MRIVFAMPGNEAMAAAIARGASAELGRLEARHFPDRESYIRILDDVRGKTADIVCTLAHPDARIMPLVLAAGALREWGAAHVRLIAPYLAYLRQDKHFAPGEALSAVHFARLVSAHFDGLVTIDPHLHRIGSLSDVYAIPARAARAAPLLGAWIRDNVEHPIVIGPDSESRQWVAAAAAAANAEYLILDKTRRGDAVAFGWPDLSGAAGKTPVLVDDIASSGETVRLAAEGMVERGLGKPYAVVVHALFDDAAFARLSDACRAVISTDAVAHASNAISVASLLIEPP